MARYSRMATASQSQNGIASGTEGLVCFVCDVGVVGRYYSLATCRTQTTRVRLIEKLGHLVGEEYMVVIAEDDIICRGCATMINSLDRLEKELGSLRSMVLRYLEKKYELEEGELVNNKPTPPNPQTKDNPTRQPRELNPHDFQARKKKAMSGNNDRIPDEVSNSGKNASWLQCDKCKYTTNLNSYMAHHARNHNKKKEAMEAAAAANQTAGTSSASHNATFQQQSTQQIMVQDTEVKHIQDISKQISISQIQQNGEDKLVQIHRLMENESETITGDLGENEVKNDSSESVEMMAGEIEPEMDEEEQNGEVLTMVEVDNGRHVTIQSVEGEDGNNTLCMVDENGIIVQKVEQAEDGTLYVQMPEGTTDSSKQVLSVGDDGSVHMVEVLWDDMVSADETENHGMVTF